MVGARYPGAAPMKFTNTYNDGGLTASVIDHASELELEALRFMEQASNAARDVQHWWAEHKSDYTETPKLQCALNLFHDATVLEESEAWEEAAAAYDVAQDAFLDLSSPITRWFARTCFLAAEQARQRGADVATYLPGVPLEAVSAMVMSSYAHNRRPMVDDNGHVLARELHLWAEARLQWLAIVYSFSRGRRSDDS